MYGFEKFEKMASIGSSEDIQKWAKRLGKAVDEPKSVDNGECLELLTNLDNTNIAFKDLQLTKIGKIVNKLRKENQNDEIKTLCKYLVKKWMDQVNSKQDPTGDPKPLKRKRETESPPRSKAYSGSSPETNEKRDASSSFPKRKYADKSETTPSPSAAAQSDSSVEGGRNGTESRTLVGLMSISSDTSDEVRIKFREMLVDSLSKTDPWPEEARQPERVACGIECAVYEEFRQNSNDSKYKNRLRQKVMALRDKRNPMLRAKVLTSEIAPDDFAKMTADEMASEEVKKMRQKFTEEAIKDHQMGTTSGTQTSMFKCGKCKKKNCTYTQLQTRSSDEPMTTFVLCNECGNRWKFC